MTLLSLSSVVLAALLCLQQSNFLSHAMHISVKLLLHHGHAVEIGMPMHLRYIDHAGCTYIHTEFAYSITKLRLIKARPNNQDIGAFQPLCTLCNQPEIFYQPGTRKARKWLVDCFTFPHLFVCLCICTCHMCIMTSCTPLRGRIKVPKRTIYCRETYIPRKLAYIPRKRHKRAKADCSIHTKVVKMSKR